MTNDINDDEPIVEDDGSAGEESVSKIKKYDITSYPADYTITTVLSKYNKTIIVPEFQRRYVWSRDVVKQSRLIESLLLGLPVPQIFLFQRKDDKNLLIIDGFQRLNTIHRFCSNEFALEGVQEEWATKKFSDFSSEDKEQFDNTTIRAIIVRQISPDDKYSSMYHIFERLNTGGITLSPMEIRKAISYGDFYKTLATLNGYRNWQLIINRTFSDLRLRDVEYILRLFTLYSSDLTKYEEPLKDFLTDYMHKNKDNALDDLADIFKKVCDDVITELGAKPFHVPKGRLNLAVLDSVLVAKMKKATVTDFKQKYSALLADSEYSELIQTRDATKKPKLKRRMELAESFIK